MPGLDTIINGVTSQCGLLGLVLFAALIYQTVRLERERAQRDDDRRQIIADAEARTRTAEAATAAIRELAMRPDQRRRTRD